MLLLPGRRPQLRRGHRAARPSRSRRSASRSCARSPRPTSAARSPHDEVVNALRADLTGYPPMLIQAGTGDVLGKDAHRLAEHARRARRRRAVRALPGDHARLPRVLVVPARGRRRPRTGRRLHPPGAGHRRIPPRLARSRHQPGHVRTGEVCAAGRWDRRAPQMVVAHPSCRVRGHRPPAAAAAGRPPRPPSAPRAHLLYAAHTAGRARWIPEVRAVTAGAAVRRGGTRWGCGR